MPYLLDTCAFLWLNDYREKISPRAMQAMQEHPEDLFISAISAFEIGVKNADKKLALMLEPEEWFRQAICRFGINYVPINFQIATKSTQLPLIHRDPCDRIIIATAQEYNMKILTPDQTIRRYDEARCVW